MLQCGAVCCSVVQCGAVWCSVVQCVAVWYSVVQCGAVWCSVVQCDAVWCSVLQCQRAMQEEIDEENEWLGVCMCVYIRICERAQRVTRMLCVCEFVLSCVCVCVWEK